MKRSLSILLLAGLFAFSACHPEPYLSVSPDSLSFTESGGSQTVQITANYAWMATTGDAEKCFEYALKVPGLKDDRNLLVGVLINSASQRGIASLSESRQSGIAYYGASGNVPASFGNTLRHEAGGHGFAFLDDEYWNIQGAAPKEHVENRTTLYGKYGWYSNVDFTDDPAKVKWSIFLSDERYKDEVGIFESGSLYSRGAYRPSENSMMKDNLEYYNAPSRWAIYKRIMELSGEEASFEEFLEYDAVNRGAAAAAAAAARPPLKAAAASKRDSGHSAPPVVIP